MVFHIWDRPVYNLVFADGQARMKKMEIIC